MATATNLVKTAPEAPSVVEEPATQTSDATTPAAVERPDTLAPFPVVEPGVITAPEPRDEPPTIEDVRAVVRKHYPEELWQGVKTAIGVIASLSLAGRDNCLVLVYEGAPSMGKSVIVRIVSPDRPDACTLQVDKFTPAAFVSSAASRTEEELRKNDLLPRIQGKTMVTKELAPLFRGEFTQLLNNFSILTAILDGRGFKTDTGTHGERGYYGDYTFNWLGATTQIPISTHKVMAQLGNRLLFYEIQGEESSVDDLLAFAMNDAAADPTGECQKAANDFLKAYFEKHPVGTVAADSVSIPEELMLVLVQHAVLIGHGRAAIDREKSKDEEQSVEGAYRVINLLKMLVRGLALADGRSVVSPEDMDVVRHVAFSSIPASRRNTLRALLAGGGMLDAGELDKALSCKRPTSLKRMQELAATGLCTYQPGIEEKSTPAMIHLAKKWKWLLSYPPKRITGCVSVSIPP